MKPTIIHAPECECGWCLARCEELAGRFGAFVEKRPRPGTLRALVKKYTWPKRRMSSAQVDQVIATMLAEDIEEQSEAPRA